MLLKKANEEAGAALLELVTFILLGQLLVTGWMIQLAGELDHKTRLQLFASSLARSIAVDNPQEESLRKDFGLALAKVEITTCAKPNVCLKVSAKGSVVLGLSRR